MVEINFLCVHKKLRSKRLAPVLIREITRRVNLKGKKSLSSFFNEGILFFKKKVYCSFLGSNIIKLSSTQGCLVRFRSDTLDALFSADKRSKSSPPPSPSHQQCCYLQFPPKISYVIWSVECPFYEDDIYSTLKCIQSWKL